MRTHAGRSPVSPAQFRRKAQQSWGLSEECLSKEKRGNTTIEQGPYAIFLDERTVARLLSRTDLELNLVALVGVLKPSITIALKLHEIGLGAVGRRVMGRPKP